MGEREAGGGAWQRVARLEKLEDPGTRGFAHAGWEHYGFVVRDGAHVAAFVNVCPHAGHPLHYAPHAFLTADGALIICSSHGAVFDKRSGECVGGPCPGSRLQPVQVRVVDGWVEVAVGATSP